MKKLPFILISALYIFITGCSNSTAKTPATIEEFEMDEDYSGYIDNHGEDLLAFYCAGPMLPESAHLTDEQYWYSFHGVFRGSSFYVYEHINANPQSELAEHDEKTTLYYKWMDYESREKAKKQIDKKNWKYIYKLCEKTCDEGSIETKGWPDDGPYNYYHLAEMNDMVPDEVSQKDNFVPETVNKTEVSDQDSSDFDNENFYIHDICETNDGFFYVMDEDFTKENPDCLNTSIYFNKTNHSIILCFSKEGTPFEQIAEISFVMNQPTFDKVYKTIDNIRKNLSKTPAAEQCLYNTGKDYTTYLMSLVSNKLVDNEITLTPEQNIELLNITTKLNDYYLEQENSID